MYGLLPDERQATYTSFLQILKQADATLNPDVSTDYENAAINAFMQFSLTPVTVQGCLSQYVYRRVQAQGLQRDYATHHELSLQIRMVLAMACIPVANIPLHLKRYKMIPQRIYNLLLIILKMCSSDALDAMVGWTQASHIACE